MAINLTIQFTKPSPNPQYARDYEARIAEWLERLIRDNCAFQVPDIHIDLIDEPWSLPSPQQATPSPGLPLA